ncbi:MAG: hypothetical protein LLG14_22805 [Nocardiaceae bacterium]|nr:hypothetical protein [Nocardiaceae bacterium]
MHRLTAANDFVASLPVRFGVPIRRAFVSRSGSGASSPLGDLMSSRSSRAGGGRGGKQRLALLLTALWVNSRDPYSSQRPASWWADMIGLSDPSSQAATRSVKANLKELADRKFILLEPGRNGYPATVTLLSELGSGAPYSRPRLDAHPNYFRVPETLWTRNSLIGKLDARGLAMYLILASYHNAEMKSETWFSERSFRERHGLAEATRLGGLNQLVNLGVANMHQVFPNVQTPDGYRTVKRRYYELTPDFAPPPRRTWQPQTKSMEL